MEIVTLIILKYMTGFLIKAVYKGEEVTFS